jgi:hypothetical protein
MISVQKCNSLHVTAYTPDDGPCETETCHVVVEEGHETEGVKPGTALKTVLVYIYIYIYIKFRIIYTCPAFPKHVYALTHSVKVVHSPHTEQFNVRGFQPLDHLLPTKNEPQPSVLLWCKLRVVQLCSLLHYIQRCVGQCINMPSHTVQCCQLSTGYLISSAYSGESADIF